MLEMGVVLSPKGMSKGSLWFFLLVQIDLLVFIELARSVSAGRYFVGMQSYG